MASRRPARRSLEGLAAHDVERARLSECAQRQAFPEFPFAIDGIFAPVGALPGGDFSRTLSVIDLDVRGLTIREASREGETAVVELGGVLVERFDPPEVEALFRAYAAESGQRVERDLLRETMANVSGGDVRLPVRQEVRVVLEAGEWKVCDPLPTP